MIEILDIYICPLCHKSLHIRHYYNSKDKTIFPVYVCFSAACNKVTGKKSREPMWYYDVITGEPMPRYD